MDRIDISDITIATTINTMVITYLLMLAPSLRRMPDVCAEACRSEPARSTRFTRLITECSCLLSSNSITYRNTSKSYQNYNRLGNLDYNRLGNLGYNRLGNLDYNRLGNLGYNRLGNLSAVNHRQFV